MFLSLRHPPIADARTQAAISKARNQNGLHIYFNKPHTKPDNEFNTPLADMAGTKSTYLTWTSVLRAKEAGASFGLNIRPDGAHAGLGYGIYTSKGQYYAARNEGNTKWGGYQYYSTVSLKKGQYVVMTMHVRYPPQGTTVEPIKVEINGFEQATPVTFNHPEDFSMLGSKLIQDKSSFFDMEMLEIHFLYSGITQGLPLRPSPADYISLQTAKLGYITQWDTVILQGQYAALNGTFKGILVGVSAANKSPAYYVFESYQGDSATVTIRLKVGFNDVAISTDKEQRALNMAIGPDDNAWLLIDNINISNLEIHTTAKIEK